MQLNGNDIIRFIQERNQIKKKDIAIKIYGDEKFKYKLSRKKPPLIEPELFFSLFFDFSHLECFERENNESKLLDALYYFLAKLPCYEAKYIKQQRDKGDKYRNIIIEVLKRANMGRNTKILSDVKSKHIQDDTKEDNVLSKSTLISSEEDVNNTRDNTSATLSSDDDSFSAKKVLLKKQPKFMRDVANKVIK